MTRLTNASYVKIVLLVLLALVLCGGIVSCSVRCTPPNIPRVPVHLNGDTSVIAREIGAGSVAGANVQNVAIAWAAGSATVTVCEDAETNGEIVFSETGSGVRKTPLHWGCENGTLVIDYTSANGLIGCSDFGSKHLDLKIPRSVAQNLGHFEMNVASGDYQVDGLSCDTMTLGIASGSFASTDVVVQALDVDMASGRLALAGDFPDTVKVELASGTADITSAHCPTYGDLNIASGNVTLALPAQSAFELNYDALTGQLNSDFPHHDESAHGHASGKRGGAIYGESGAQVTGRFDVDMASGSLAFRAC